MYVEKQPTTPICLATVRHTGTHTLSHIFTKYWLRHALTENWRRDTDAGGALPMWFGHCEPGNMDKLLPRCSEAGVVVTTMRHPMRVYESWLKRGRKVADFFCQSWEFLFDIHAKHDAYFVPVDAPKRDEYLKRFADRCGIEIETDWPRLNASTRKVETRPENMGSIGEDEVRKFLEQFDFAQFGYDLDD